MAMLSAAGARTFDMDTVNAVEVMLALCGGGVVAMIALGSDRADLSPTLGSAVLPPRSLDIMIMAAMEAYAGMSVALKLCGPADVRQGRRTALEHGEDRLHL